MPENIQPLRYFAVYKPINMVSQFISPDKVGLLGDLEFDFPEGTHAIGRLDSQSEGLLLLTTDKRITRLLFQSKIPHNRTYLVQVLQHMSAETLQLLRDGVEFKIKGNVNWTSSPCEAKIVEKPLGLHVIENELLDFIPHTWVEITLTEGKFHQIRKMVKTLRHKCRRLIRLSIENITLNEMKPGEVKEMEQADFYLKLNISIP
jgi:23S rRNA pseudouridine2457 synthase